MSIKCDGCRECKDQNSLKKITLPYRYYEVKDCKVRDYNNGIKNAKEFSPTDKILMKDFYLCEDCLFKFGDFMTTYDVFSWSFKDVFNAIVNKGVEINVN